MAQDVYGVEVMLCHSRLVWLVFEGSVLHALVFVQETFFCDFALMLPPHCYGQAQFAMQLEVDPECLTDTTILKTYERLITMLTEPTRFYQT